MLNMSLVSHSVTAGYSVGNVYCMHVSQDSLYVPGSPLQATTWATSAVLFVFIFSYFLLFSVKVLCSCSSYAWIAL